jgi:hypothetical protein
VALRLLADLLMTANRSIISKWQIHIFRGSRVGIFLIIPSCCSESSMGEDQAAGKVVLAARHDFVEKTSFVQNRG